MGFIFSSLDWVLYLMSGQLKCNVSSGKNKIGTDQELLGKGYKISMVQKNVMKPTKLEPNVICEMEAILRLFYYQFKLNLN